ncbi:unnamed protein product [Mytilus coruscus]|uniref:Uncharacterized protein n=1 Tax=Mytilus coruscus TaxID=42192 RepID=A0A6J8C1S8_MYTCO|nr:unnamed protein product [Mytilus coruscus]
MKHIQQDVTKNDKFIESLLKKDNMNHVTLSFEKENTLKTLPTALNTMGTIILDRRPSDTTLASRKIKQAQIMVPITHVPTIDDLKLNLRQTVKIFGDDIISCSLLPDGRMIFSCYDTAVQINVLKPDGSLDFTLQPRSYTSHIHFIEDNEKLVVTSGMNKSITIIDMQNRKTEKSIKVESWIYGIVYKDGKLFYNGGRRGLCVVSLDDDSVTQLVNAILTPNSSIATWSDKLYYIDNNDSITCCDLQGTFKWKLELAAFLRGPQGITVDNYGRVFVSGFHSNNVVVISPDGNKHRLLLSGKDGLKLPQSLFFDRKNNKLLISNQKNRAFLYDVSNR